MKKLALVLAGISGLSTAAIAQDADNEVDAVTHMGLTTGMALDAAMEKTFDQGQINMLKSVAHQQAVAMTCAGFTVDEAKFRTEMNRIYYNSEGDQVDLTPEQLHDHEKMASMGFGMALGSQLAIAAYDHDAFCAHAAEERMAEDQTHIIWASAE